MAIPLLALCQRILQLFALGDVPHINTKAILRGISADIKNVVSTTDRTLVDKILRLLRCQRSLVNTRSSRSGFGVRKNIVDMFPQRVFSRDAGELFTGFVPIRVPKILVQSEEDICDAFGKFSVFRLALF